MLQAICRDGCNWDDPISEELEQNWKKWANELSKLSELQIQRCYKTTDMIQAATVELHHFCDASEVGYGQCSYLKIEVTRTSIVL